MSRREGSTGALALGTAAGGGVLDIGRFKEAMAHFPSGVTIVTTREADGTRHGFTASSFCSVSLDPPLVCVCVAHSARCHPVFAEHDEFAINFLRPEHADLAMRFAGRSEDKFADGPFRQDDPRLVEDALAVLECVVHSRHEAGDHTMLVGEVRWVDVSAGEPLVFFNRAFHRVAELRS